ncbi:MAG: hypothetical protein ACO2Y2_03205 [Poseidonia sp.]
MIERLLRPLTELSGVMSVHLVERDGFVVYSSGPPAGSDEIERWQALVQSSTNDATTTLVMEHGYLILSPVAPRTLAVKCDRSTNLGLARSTINEVRWPA